MKGNLLWNNPLGRYVHVGIRNVSYLFNQGIIIIINPLLWTYLINYSSLSWIVWLCVNWEFIFCALFICNQQTYEENGSCDYLISAFFIVLLGCKGFNPFDTGNTP